MPENQKLAQPNYIAEKYYNAELIFIVYETAGDDRNNAREEEDSLEIIVYL